MQITVIWWNTSLAPIARVDRASSDDQAVVNALMSRFAAEADIICLGEVTEREVERLRTQDALSGYDIEVAQTDVERIRFDTYIAFRAEKLCKLGQIPLIDYGNGRALKIGMRFDLKVIEDGTTFHLFVAHWPSRLWCDAHHPDRDRLALRLRDAVTDVLGADYSSHVIVAGDFNDEPFGVALEHHLLATRDSELVTRRRHLLYNPFWRHLGARRRASIRDPGTRRLSGSYHYKSGRVTRWHTFDQMIFSSSFMGHSNWRLRESSVRIMDIPEYTYIVLDGKRYFDHLPIAATIERAE